MTRILIFIGDYKYIKHELELGLSKFIKRIKNRRNFRRTLGLFMSCESTSIMNGFLVPEAFHTLVTMIFDAIMLGYFMLSQTGIMNRSEITFIALK